MPSVALALAYSTYPVPFALLFDIWSIKEDLLTGLFIYTLFINVHSGAFYLPVTTAEKNRKTPLGQSYSVLVGLGQYEIQQNLRMSVK